MIIICMYVNNEFLSHYKMAYYIKMVIKLGKWLNYQSVVLLCILIVKFDTHRP